MQNRLVASLRDVALFYVGLGIAWCMFWAGEGIAGRIVGLGSSTTFWIVVAVISVCIAAARRDLGHVLCLLILIGLIWLFSQFGAWFCGGARWIVELFFIPQLIPIAVIVVFLLAWHAHRPNQANPDGSINAEFRVIATNHNPAHTPAPAKGSLASS